MPNSLDDWDKTPISDILTFIREPIELDDLTEYKTITVKRNHGGLVDRERLFGYQILTKNAFKIIPNSFIISRVQCWHKAFAFIEKVDPFMIVSQNYDQFLLSSKIDRRFFWWLTHSPTFVSTIRDSAQGVDVEKMVFNRDAWLEKTLLIPSLPTQERMGKLIDNFMLKIEKIKSFQIEAMIEREFLIDSELKRIVDKGKKNKDWLFDKIPIFARVNPSTKGKKKNIPLSQLVSFVPMTAVDDESGTITDKITKSFYDVSKGYTFFEEGDVLFARITPCMENGKSFIANNLKNGIGLGSTEFHVLKPESNITKEWLHLLLRQKEFKIDAKNHFKGTAGQQRVPSKFLEEKIIPVPPTDIQNQIVEHIQKLQTSVLQLKELQQHIIDDLNDLKLSLLNKAFSGNLIN